MGFVQVSLPPKGPLLPALVKKALRTNDPLRCCFQILFSGKHHKLLFEALPFSIPAQPAGVETECADNRNVRVSSLPLQPLTPQTTELTASVNILDCQSLELEQQLRAIDVCPFLVITDYWNADQPYHSLYVDVSQSCVPQATRNTCSTRGTGNLLGSTVSPGQMLSTSPDMTQFGPVFVEACAASTTINPGSKLLFNAIPQYAVPHIHNYLTSLGFHLLYDSCCYKLKIGQFTQAKLAELSQQLKDLGNDLSISQLDAPDARIVDDTWAYKGQGTHAKLQLTIQRHGSSCIRAQTQDSSKPVAWILLKESGDLGTAFTLDSHRRRGLMSLCVADLALRTLSGLSKHAANPLALLAFKSVPVDAIDLPQTVVPGCESKQEIAPVSSVAPFCGSIRCADHTLSQLADRFLAAYHSGIPWLPEVWGYVVQENDASRLMLQQLGFQADAVQWTWLGYAKVDITLPAKL